MSACYVCGIDLISSLGFYLEASSFLEVGVYMRMGMGGNMGVFKVGRVRRVGLFCVVLLLVREQRER